MPSREPAGLGARLRAERRRQRLTQAELADRVGYSITALSRWETGERPLTDVRILRALAEALHVAPATFGVLDESPPPRHAETTRTPEEPDPMRRRTLLTAGLVVPAEMFARVDSALALAPCPDRAIDVEQLRDRVAAARDLFSADKHAALMADLPGLLGDAHALLDVETTQRAFVAVASAYDVATEILLKVGRLPSARLTSDRSAAYARMSEQPVARALAARHLSSVLRHEGRPNLAHQVALDGAARLDAAGLSTRPAALAYVQMMATCSYNAAVGNRRDDALALIDEAEQQAARLPGNAHGGATSVAGVRLYRVGVHWALGDAGTAVAVAETLRPGQFGTPERRGRLYTDTARAWHQRGRPEETARALLDALATAPGEVRHRPTVRAIAVELTQRHPHLSTVQTLATALAGPTPTRR